MDSLLLLVGQMLGEQLKMPSFPSFMQICVTLYLDLGERSNIAIKVSAIYLQHIFKARLGVIGINCKPWMP